MYTVNIRDRTTGFVRPHEVEFDWDDNQKWLWTEGNFGCDCNRRIFFGDDRSRFRVGGPEQMRHEAEEEKHDRKKEERKLSVETVVRGHFSHRGTLPRGMKRPSIVPGLESVAGLYLDIFFLPESSL